MNTNDKKYYSVELNKVEADAYRTFLKINNIYYEPSQCGDLIHFEVLCSPAECDKCNEFLDTI